MSVRLKPSFCAHCGRVNDAATGVGGAYKPKPGDIAICFYCAGISVYALDLMLRLPTYDELSDAMSMPMVRKAKAAIQQRLK